MWDSGVFTWDDVKTPKVAKQLARIPKQLVSGLEESEKQLRRENPHYFTSRLPASSHWRLFSDFRTGAVYLDIETTGLGAGEDEITTIAMYDGTTISYYVNGRNLGAFLEDVAAYQVIVTYNGKCFDVPFIERYFGVSMPQAHIDLRYILHSLGLKGGLKGCERALGFNRGVLDGVDGFFAVLLWDEYINNRNTRALDTLLAYNIQDVISLENLMVIAYNLKLAGTPFKKSHQIFEAEIPQNPFEPDVQTIEQIKSKIMGGGMYEHNRGFFHFPGR